MPRLARSSAPTDAEHSTTTLYERIEHARECLALVTLALHVNREHLLGSDLADINPSLLFNATHLATGLATKAWADLTDIDLPRPVQDWREGTTDEDLITALQEYAQGGQEILRRAATVRRQRTSGGAR
jgi:hypothetical protein